MIRTVLNVQQGSKEWLAARAASDGTASEAPAMMGKSKYMSRTELLDQRKTGIAKEVNATTQALFNRGHETEANARPIAERIIGEDLSPTTIMAEIDGLKLLASLDGITFGDDVDFEHKLYSESLAEQVRSGNLEEHYTIQMDQELLVSGAEKCLFMVSDGTEEKCVWMWYRSTPEKQAALIAGWKQFHKDLADHVPAEVVHAPVAAPVIDLPAVSVQVSGSITVADNFKIFETALRDFVDNRLIKKPQTDQDFADLTEQIKSLEKAEAALDAAEASMLAQVETVDTLKRTKDMLHKLARDNRLAAQKLLEAEKLNRRNEIVRGGTEAFTKHIQELNERLGKPYMPQINADFAGAIKGLRTITSLQNAVDTELARVKAEAETIAAKIETNLNSLRELAKDHPFLFADTSQLVMKANDDLVTLIKMRISEHQQAEAAKLEAERERIRQEEETKARAAAAAEQAKREAAELATKQAGEAEKQSQQASPSPAIVHPGTPYVVSANDTEVKKAEAAPVVIDDGATMKLGEIAKLLGFSLTEQFIEELGVKSTGRDRNAVLYRCADFPVICERLIANINAASVDFFEQRKVA
jgi:predicted phage-related endonuclease